MTADTPRLREGPFLLGLFLVTAATLALEVLTTRLLSVLTWYSLAFLVIAMGMFGLTAGAVRVYLRADRYTPDKLARSLAGDALAFALLVPVGYVLLLVVPLRVAPAWTTAALFVVFAAAIALPFVAAGMVVAAAVTRSPFPTGRVYAVDLAGAAVGAPLVPELLERVDAGTAILLMSVVGAAAAAAFAASVEDAPLVRRASSIGLVLAILTLLNGSTHRGLVPIWAKGRAEDPSGVAFEAWNSHSRVQVSNMAPAFAALWGGGSKCRAPIVNQRMIVIDADAATPLYEVGGDLEKLRFLDCDVTNIAHHLRPSGPMAIIGVGGSRDIQAALLAGHAPVFGIEMNRRLLEIIKGPLGAPTGIANHRDVKLVHDEARSYLARTPRTYRVIQASLIDTWAATGAGAHALGENGLYTLEAWRLFLERLEPGGVVTFSRWSSSETVRLVALAVAALMDRGVAHPREHLALVNAGPVTTLVVGRDPLTEEDGAILRRVADEKGFTVAIGPGFPVPGGPLGPVLAATDRAALDAATLLPDIDLRPPTDDRPFFFNVVRLGAFARSLPETTSGTIEGNRMATTTLVLSLFASIALAVAAIVIPLARRAKPKGTSGRGLSASLAYFGLIGVGFMLCEVGLLQRLSLVLGHPSYSLIVVLASLVASAGVGSFFSDRLPLDRAPLSYVYPLVLAAVVASLAFVLPHFAPLVEPLGVRARIGFATAVTSVVGLVLGVAFPVGMRIARAQHDDEAPWLWGVNGVGGVVASSAAVMIGLSAGLRWLFVVAALCYVALLPFVFLMQRGAQKER